MEVELRFFATFREAVGQKSIRKEFEDDAVSVAEILQDLEAEYPEIDIFEADSSLRGYITVLKNGREITHVDGLDTVLEDGDSLSVFPPVAGG